MRIIPIILAVCLLMAVKISAQVINAGVGGNTTSDLLQRLDQDVLVHQPELVILMVGPNDMLNSKKLILYQVYQKNIEEIVRRIREGGADILIMSSPPADSAYLFQRHDHKLYAETPNEKMNRARDIVESIAAEYGLYIKNQGIPLNVQVAAIEFAILDMLGNVANKPAGLLIGDLQRKEIPIYLGHHYSNLRRLEPEESLELMYQDAIETNAKAVKLRAGRGDNLATDIDNAPGRTEKLIRLGREKFGDDFTLMIDGNGSYAVKEAIRIGKILEAYNYYFYEEPIPWDWYEEQKQVEQALNIPMAGGEEEFGLHAFRYLIGNEVFQILQPDIFYFGGMIRTMKVARMAEAAGLKITPHMSRGGLGFIYLMHMVSVCPAAEKYHEFKLFATPDANGTNIPIESKAEPFESSGGAIKVTSGSGLGITIDPDYIKTHKVVES